MPSKQVATAARFVVGPLIDDSDFKTLETGVAFNAAGMDVSLYEETQEGTSKTALTLTSGGTQDWVELGDGYYYVEVTAAQLNTAGIAWVGGVATGILPFESVHYDVVDPTNANDLAALMDTLSSGAFTSTSFAANSIAAAAIASDVSAEIADAVWDEAKADHTTASTFGDIPTDVDTILARTMSAAQLTKFGYMLTTTITGTIDTAAHTPTTTEFECDDITEATADHFIGKQVFFVDGPLAGQRTDVTDYALTGGRGHFTVTAMTDAPANDNTLILI